MTEAGVRGGDLCAVGSAVEARDRPFRAAGTARRGEQTGLDGQSCMIEFQPVLLRQRDHVIEDAQTQTGGSIELICRTIESPRTTPPRTRNHNHR